MNEFISKVIFFFLNFKAITWNSKWWVNVRNVQFNWKASIGDKIKRHQFNRKEVAWPVIGKLIDIFSLSLFLCLCFAFQSVQMLQISVNIIFFFPTFFRHYYFVCHLVRHDLRPSEKKTGLTYNNRMVLVSKWLNEFVIDGDVEYFDTIWTVAVTCLRAENDVIIDF